MTDCTPAQHRLAIYSAPINATWCACLEVLIEGWHTTRTPSGRIHHRCTCHPAGYARPDENEGEPRVA